jgi:O-antigen ligase
MKVITEDRISSFFGDELKMGGFLMRFFPFLIALNFFFYKKKQLEKFSIPAFSFIVLVLVTIFLSGERTSFILFNFTIILLILFLNDLRKIKIFILLIYSLVFVLLFSLDTPFKKRIFDLTIEQTQIYEKKKQKYIFSKQYHEHYLSAWKMFTDNILIGVGPKNFRVKCKDKNYNFSKLTCSTHPHNFPLQLLAETGLFSFLIYLIINILIWFNLFKNLFSKIIYKKKTLSNFQISLLVNIAILIWPLAPNGNLFNNWLSIILYYPVGFLLWEFRNSKKMYLKSIKK